MIRLTQRPFPSYTYVPGKTPHPIRESTGHSYQQPEPFVESFSSDEWPKCEAYLFGIDLFNAGFFWESHEQWEAVWHAVGRVGTTASFLKGLIKLSAAGVKSLEQKPNGVQRHAHRAAELFAEVQEQCSSHCGLELESLRQWAFSIESTLKVDLKLIPRE